MGAPRAGRVSVAAHHAAHHAPIHPPCVVWRVTNEKRTTTCQPTNQPTPTNQQTNCARSKNSRLLLDFDLIRNSLLRLVSTNRVCCWKSSISLNPQTGRVSAGDNKRAVNHPHANSSTKYFAFFPCPPVQRFISSLQSFKWGRFNTFRPHK